MAEAKLKQTAVRSEAPSEGVERAVLREALEAERPRRIELEMELAWLRHELVGLAGRVALTPPAEGRR